MILSSCRAYFGLLIFIINKLPNDHQVPNECAFDTTGTQSLFKGNLA